MATAFISFLALAVLQWPASVSAGTVCALTRDGTAVTRWDGSTWLKIGNGAHGIYGDASGLVATIPENYQAWAWHLPGNNDWQKIGGGGSEFVVTRGSVYGLTPNRDKVYQWFSGEDWLEIGGATGNIYGGGGQLFATNPDNTAIWHYLNGNGWEKVGGGGSDFAVDGNGVLYGLSDIKDAVYQWTGSGENWVKIGGPASRLFAGGIGLFAVTPTNSEIWRHLGGENWVKVGGGGSQFAVTDEGLYGEDNDENGVWRWNGDGENWTSLGVGGAQQLTGCP